MLLELLVIYILMLGLGYFIFDINPIYPIALISRLITAGFFIGIGIYLLNMTLN